MHKSSALDSADCWVMSVQRACTCMAVLHVADVACNTFPGQSCTSLHAFTMLPASSNILCKHKFSSLYANYVLGGCHTLNNSALYKTRCHYSSSLYRLQHHSGRGVITQTAYAGSEGKALDKYFAAHMIDLYGKVAPASQQATMSPSTSAQPKANSQSKPYSSPQANNPQARPHATPEAEPCPRSALPTPAGPSAAVSTVQALHSSRQRSEQSHGEQQAQPPGSQAIEEVLRLAELDAAECVKAEPDSDLEYSIDGSVSEAELDSQLQPEAQTTTSAPPVTHEAYLAPSRAREPSQMVTARTGTRAEAPQHQSEPCVEVKLCTQN